MVETKPMACCDGPYRWYNGVCGARYWYRAGAGPARASVHLSRADRPPVSGTLREPPRTYPQHIFTGSSAGTSLTKTYHINLNEYPTRVLVTVTVFSLN